MVNFKKNHFQNTKLYIAGIGGAAFIGVVFLLFVFLSRETTPIPQIQETEKDSTADMQFQKIHYTSTNDRGIIEWELKAVSANYFKENKLAELQNIDVTFYTKDGRTFTLRGNTGSLNTATKDIRIAGDVVGTSSDGFSFRTKSLNYQADKNQAKAQGKVFLDGPQFVLQGQGMIVDIDTQKVFLLKNVSAQAKR